MTLPVLLFVFYADLDRAVLETADGRRVKAELAVLQSAVEDEVSKREAALALLQKELEKSGSASTRERYNRDADALQRYIETEEKQLDAKQESLLAPILEKMRKLLPRSEAVVLDQSEHPIVNRRPSCDATSWVAHAYERGGKEAMALSKQDACAARVAMVIDRPLLSAQLPEGKRAVSRLNALQQAKQEELDREQRKLRGGEGKPEHERARLALAERYAAYKRELEAREQAEQGKVDDAVRALIATLENDLAGALFIEKLDGVDPVPFASCDVTKVMLELVERKATSKDVERACAAYAGAGSEGKR